MMQRDFAGSAGSAATRAPAGTSSPGSAQETCGPGRRRAPGPTFILVDELRFPSVSQPAVNVG